MASEEWPFSNAWSLHGNKDIVSQYEILERIGQGTFAEVHRARRRKDNLIVALKEIHDFDTSNREVKALLLLDHPNVVKLHGYFAQGSNMVLVLEYLPYSLSEVIRAGKGELSDAEVKGWMIQILRGLAVCQAASILHRDLKPNNLLISEDGVLKIADFGQARILSEVDVGNKERPCVSDCDNDHSTDSDRGHDAPRSNNQELELQGDVSALEGRLVSDKFINASGVSSRSSNIEVSGDYFGVGISKDMEKDNFFKAPMESIPLARDFASGLMDSDNFEGKDTRFGSGLTNVGFSALADAVKDARNYFTVGEMVRSGSEIDGLGLSSLQKQQIIASQPTEDVGCCGWFPVENVEGHPALTGGRKVSARKETAVKDSVVSDRRDQATEREVDFSSEESDIDWKGKSGMSSEGLIDTLKKAEESHKAGVPCSASKGDGDLLQKFRRFIRKRTRHNAGKISGRRNERIPTSGGNSLKEAPQRDWHGLHYPRNLGPRNIASTGRHSKAIPAASDSLKTATVSMLSSQGERVSSQVQMRKGSRNSHRKEKKNFQIGSTNGVWQRPVAADGHKVTSTDEILVVSGLEDEDCAKQRLGKGGDGSAVSEKSEEEFLDGEDDGGDLRTESGRKLYGGLKVEKVESKIKDKVMLNGPLRDMAYARVHEVGATGALDQLDSKVNPRVDGRWLKILKGDEANRTRRKKSDDSASDYSGSHQHALKSPNVLAEEAVGTKTCEMSSFCGVGEKAVDSLEETLYGRWEGPSGGPLPNGDVCKSWTQTDGYHSTLSDAEGTRWYGAPDFQYSYMDSKLAGYPDRKKLDGYTTGSEEEWEQEGSEVATYRSSSENSQESTGRGDCESEHGSDFTTMVGTRWYKAPELLYGATKYGMGLDMWAVGCIFGELLSGKPLFPGLNDIDQLSRLVRILGSPNEKIWAGVSLLPDFNKICFVDDRSPLTLKKYLPHISEAALDCLRKLLTYDPVLRPTAGKALKDEFFFKLPLPLPCHELQLPSKAESDDSDEKWGNWKDPGSPFSDFEILG